MTGLEWLVVKEFLAKHWKALVLIVVATVAFGLVFKAGRDSREKDVLAAKLEAASCTANYASLQSQLASADAAAKRAKAEAEKAAVAAQKRLQAREDYWKRLYAHDPQAKAWGEQAIPPKVLEGLAQ